MIKSVAKIFAEILGKSLQAGKGEMAIYSYGLEILLGAMLKIALILLISAILGILHPCLVFLGVFFLFRWLGGGVHLKTYWGCVLFGTILVITMGKVSQLNFPVFYLVTFFAMTVLFSLWVCIKWVPGGTDKKSISDPAVRKKQKMETLLAIAFWSVGVVLCLLTRHLNISWAAILAAFWSSFFVTPIGYESITLIDKLYFKIKGGGENV